MKRLTRRRAVGALGAAALLRALPYARASTTPVPFEPGDVVAGCTLLDDPDDDHRGRGRILHFDARLAPKNVIWLPDTTHIVQGTRFAADGTLWAFDVFAHKVARFASNGSRLPDFPTPPRSFGHASFARSGEVYLGENLVGATSKARLRTTLPFMPGTTRFGDGHLFRFSADGALLQEYATATHGGMGGFLGLSASALSRNERTLYYTSESGPRLFRYDLASARQLPDLVGYPDNTGQFFFDIAFDLRGRLLAVRGLSIEALDARTGAVLQTYALPAFGWASMSTPVTTAHVHATNFYSGKLARIALDDGRVIAEVDVGMKKSLSGVAEVPPTQQESA